ncbi:MAG: hypothetical protein QOD40_1490, partial [Alphaproteobacteria bacterium]|nr:hypothetical protein [Alphaproteobacteria bacterium]
MSRAVGYARAEQFLRKLTAVDDGENPNDISPSDLKNSYSEQSNFDPAQQINGEAVTLPNAEQLTSSTLAKSRPVFQLPLKASIQPKRPNGAANKLEATDRSAHNWYRFVLSFPPHLVRDYLHRFGANAQTVCLDPFCGTATTLVECKKLGVPSVGVESHPMSFFAAQVKTDWTLDSQGLVDHAQDIAQRCVAKLALQGISDEGKNSRIRGSILRKLPQETESLLLTNSISPLPLHKTLILLDELRTASGSQYHRAELLALAQG